MSHPPLIQHHHHVIQIYYKQSIHAHPSDFKKGMKIIFLNDIHNDLIKIDSDCT